MTVMKNNLQVSISFRSSTQISLCFFKSKLLSILLAVISFNLFQKKKKNKHNIFFEISSNKKNTQYQHQILEEFLHKCDEYSAIEKGYQPNEKSGTVEFVLHSFSLNFL